MTGRGIARCGRGAVELSLLYAYSLSSLFTALHCVISSISPSADGSREGHESVPYRDRYSVTVPLSEMEK